MKEFRFAEDYLNSLVMVLTDLHNMMTSFLGEEGSKPPLTGGAFTEAIERLQSGILRIKQVAEQHLDNDPISAYSVKIFTRFLSIVARYLELYDKLDQLAIRKIRQSLHEFLLPKNQIFGAELYYFFRAKKLIGLVDSVLERGMNISEAKVNLMKFLLEIDYVLLPKRTFISAHTPKLYVSQPFLWQFRDKAKVSSLQEHILETEVEVRHLDSRFGKEWIVEADLVCKDCLLDQVRFNRKAIKPAKSILSFHFLVHFESICKHRLSLQIRLLNKGGYDIDKLDFEETLEVV